MQKAIIDKITTDLDNYPKDEISNYKDILKNLDISSDFEIDLKAKKKKIFNTKIVGASIEEIGILRENFRTSGIEKFDERINNRLKKLIKKEKYTAKIIVEELKKW
jgi:hypothetical protein